jgi:hypothetical protein
MFFLEEDTTGKCSNYMLFYLFSHEKISHIFNPSQTLFVIVKPYSLIEIQ